MPRDKDPSRGLLSAIWFTAEDARAWQCMSAPFVGGP
jgi:hypothetical protein